MQPVSKQPLGKHISAAIVLDLQEVAAATDKMKYMKQ
jgi:hypothetical protein